MPAPTPEQLGPLAGLAGTWEGSKGLDVSYHNEDSEIGDTPYRERVTLSPFGPVDNGNQHLFGLDYRMAAWRGDEEDPFHTEVGYWLWDPDREEIYRCIMVPRATVVIAGGKAAAGATSFTLKSELGSQTYGVLENPYLAENASTVAFEITINVGKDSWSYEETTTCKMAKLGGDTLAHTDRNDLTRVAE
jgi:hypothetical protein